MRKSVKSAAGRGTLYAAVVEATDVEPSKVVLDAIAEIEAIELKPGLGGPKAGLYVDNVKTVLLRATPKAANEDDLRAIAVVLGSTLQTLRAAKALPEDIIMVETDAIALSIATAAHKIKNARQTIEGGIKIGSGIVLRQLRHEIGQVRQKELNNRIKLGTRAIANGFSTRADDETSAPLEKFTDEEADAAISVKSGAAVRWVDYIGKDGKGPPDPKSHLNVGAFLEHFGIKIWHDEFSLEIKASGLAGLPAEVRVDDAVMDQMWGMMLDAGCRISEKTFASYIRMLAGRERRHPVREYLNSVEWDGTSRIETLFVDYLGVEDTELNRAWSKCFMIFAVRRVRKPGCEFAGVPILEGLKGGEGKSKFVRLLFKDWFTDALSFGDDAKLTIEHSGGAWCCEVAELEGLSGRREYSTIKATISRLSDKARLAYGRMTTNVPRQFVMIGTTNDAKYVRDQGGLRRFWTMRVNANVLDKAQKDLMGSLDQLWAEAAAREAAGEAHTLAPELYEAATEAQMRRVIKDPVEDWLESLLEAAPDGVIPNSEIKSACDAESFDFERISRGPLMSRVMSNLGFVDEQRRLPRSPKKVRCWRKGGDAARGTWLKFQPGGGDGGQFVIDRDRSRPDTLDSGQASVTVVAIDQMRSDRKKSTSRTVAKKGVLSTSSGKPPTQH